MQFDLHIASGEDLQLAQELPFEEWDEKRNCSEDQRMIQTDVRPARESTSNRELTGEELARVGVERQGTNECSLVCLMCGAVWTPQDWPDGRRRPFQWRCPNRCNW